MGWPLSQDYNEAVQNPRTSFSDAELRDGQPTLNPLGLPIPRSGNFADVYEFVCPATQTRWAIKCFTRQVAGLRERYSEISRHLQDVRLPFAVDFQFLEQGIRIRGQWYPILKMRWVEGLLLNEFVRDNLDKPAHLQSLSQIWLRMSCWLRLARIAHCDLQHGNVLLVPGSRGTRASGSPSLAVKLIDYDGMFVPALARSNSGEVGHPNYQHPQRARDGTYSLEVDRVPLLVVATALRGLIVGGRGLWDRHDNGDNLLFRESDLCDPAGSTLFRELWQLSDPLLQTLVGHLARACQGRLGDAPLLEDVLPEEKPAAPALPTAQAQGIVLTAVSSAPGSDWDFGDPASGAPPRRKKGGSAVWSWVAVAAALVLPAVAIFFATRKGGDTPKGSNVTENRPNKDRTGTDKSPPNDSDPNPPPRDDGPTLPPKKEGTKPPPKVEGTKPPPKEVPTKPPPIEPPVVQKDKRQPLPVALADAEKEIHAIFKAEYTAKSREEWQQLAGKLRDRSDQFRDRPALYYVTLRESRDAWVRSGNLEWMLKMAARLEDAFEVNPLQVRCEGLEVAGKASDLGHIQRELAETALSLFEEALDEDEYALSSRFVAVARQAAVAAKDQALLARARAAEGDLGVVRREHDRVKRSLQAVTANPTYGPDSTAVGKFLCFFKDDWDGGLPLLERGNDVALAVLARQDLAAPRDVKGRLALGDRWWIMARGMTNPVSSRARAACYQRAHHWYRQVALSLRGAAKEELEGRLKSLRTAYPVLNEPWRHLVLSDAVVSDTGFHLGPGKSAPTRRSYRGPIEVIVSARTTRNNIRLRAGRGGMVIFNGEGKPGELRIHRPDGPGGGTVGTLAVSKQEPLRARRWYELRWRLTATRMKVWVDSSLVFEEERPYDLSTREPVAVEANDSPVDVRSVVVRRIR